MIKILLLFLQPKSSYYAEVAQLVEHNLAKVGVAGSNLVFRSKSSILGWNFLFLNVIGIHARPGGGIGRHAGLKILFAETASAGSIPAPGTE